MFHSSLPSEGEDLVHERIFLLLSSFDQALLDRKEAKGNGRRVLRTAVRLEILHSKTRVTIQTTHARF